MSCFAALFATREAIAQGNANRPFRWPEHTSVFSLLIPLFLCAEKFERNVPQCMVPWSKVDGCWINWIGWNDWIRWVVWGVKEERLKKLLGYHIQSFFFVYLGGPGPLDRPWLGNHSPALEALVLVSGSVGEAIFGDSLPSFAVELYYGFSEQVVL